MFRLANRIDRAKLVRGNTHDFCRGAVSPQYSVHPIRWLVQMLLIADEDEVGFAREHRYHVSDYWLTVNFDKWLGKIVARATKPLAKPRHRDDNLHSKKLGGLPS